MTFSNDLDLPGGTPVAISSVNNKPVPVQPKEDFFEGSIALQITVRREGGMEQRREGAREGRKQTPETGKEGGEQGAPTSPGGEKQPSSTWSPGGDSPLP